MLIRRDRRIAYLRLQNRNLLSLMATGRPMQIGETSNAFEMQN
jgi:hypothetical protein